VTTDSRDGVLTDEDVLAGVEDLIAANGKLVSLGDIERESGLNARRVANRLVESGQLKVLFEGNGLPTVVAPTLMFQEALRKQRRPPWTRDLALPGRREAEDALEEQRQALVRHDTLDRLLYATGQPLEEAVALALEELGFDEVVLTGRPDDCDVRFGFEGKTGLLEAKGKAGQADKADVLQLSGWVDDEVGRGTDPDLLVAALAVDAFRERPPAERRGALTQEAERLAKRHGFAVWTTDDLHRRLQEIALASDQEAARRDHRQSLMTANYLRR